MNTDAVNVAVFADYENVAIGAREAGLEPFQIQLALERILETGNVILRKAYCDWSRYKSAKKPLHQAGFELIEVPHVSFSGKNSADIRMAVDAVDLCHTKPHIGVFAIISGDSDFSPLVGKLRENAKTVIGIGVKASSSGLLVEQCDEFVYYDDLVRAAQPSVSEERGDPAEALKLVSSTARSLLQNRDVVWGSHVKQVLKRKRPQFSERWYGFSSFNALLEEVANDSSLALRRDESSGGYRITAEAS
jgi:uncharacterized protein (TIGR00288 family)